MAIVVRSDKEASFIQKQSVNVGPGDYEIEFKKSKIFHLPRINNRSPLPKKQLPGPGQYQVEETMPTLQPNSVFKSETNRFNEPQNKIVPGPGTYDLQQRSHTEKKQEYKPKLIEQLMYAGLYQSINSIPFNKNPDRKLGPGQYEMKSSFDIPKQEKCITQNVSKVELQQDLGPGYYDIEKYYQKKITQNRKSKASTRSNSRQYVKQGLNKKIYFSFHETEDESEYEYIEDATPGPGSYEQQSFITSRISRQTQQCQERFKTLSNIAPGPGQYNPKPLTNNIQIKFGKDDRLKYPKVQIQPSAADYNNPLTLEQQMVKKLQRASLGYFGVRDNRFNSIQDNIPGPGSYNNSEIKVEKQQQSYQFRSTSNRELQTISDVPPVGEYEINDTIANKLQKELELIKEINIKKQPFNVGDKRFKEEIIKEESEEDIPEKLPNKRFMKIKRKKSPPFNTNVNFYQFQELRFREKIEQSPRPTDYQMNDQWLKRSYNLIYLNLK